MGSSCILNENKRYIIKTSEEISGFSKTLDSLQKDVEDQNTSDGYYNGQSINGTNARDWSCVVWFQMYRAKHNVYKYCSHLMSQKLSQYQIKFSLNKKQLMMIFWQKKSIILQKLFKGIKDSHTTKNFADKIYIQKFPILFMQWWFELSWSQDHSSLFGGSIGGTKIPMEHHKL